MRFNYLAVGLIWAVLGLAGASDAATPPNISYTVGVCDPQFPTRCLAPNASGAMPITGSITSSAAAFTPTSATSNVTVTATTTASAGAALPAGATDVVTNFGATTVYIAFGTSGAVSATTASYPIGPSSTVAFAAGTNTFFSVITATGSDVVTISGGSGVPALAGGGTSGGGSSGPTATAAAAPFSVTAGTNKPVGISTSSSATWMIPVKPGTTTEVDLSLPSAIIGADGTSIASTGNPLPVSQQGAVAISQTTPGITNGVSNIPLTYVLLSNGSASGSTLTNLVGGGYIFGVAGTFGGATAQLQVSDASGTLQNVSGASCTSACSIPVSISQGSSAKITLTGGSPTGIYSTLGGIGAGASSTGGTGSNGFVTQGSATSGQSGPLIQGAVTTAAPAYTTGQTSPLSLDPTGALRVNVTAGGGGGGSGSVAKTPASTTLTRIADTVTYTGATPAAPQAICLLKATTVCAPLTSTISTTTLTVNGFITGLRLVKSTTGSTASTFTVLAFNSAPTLTGVFDATTYNPVQADLTSNPPVVVGAWSCASQRPSSTGSYYDCVSSTNDSHQAFSLIDGKLYFVVEAAGPYAPGSAEAFIVVPQVLASAP